MQAKDVFVVHGRDDRARLELFHFLRAIGLNPLEWGQAIALTGVATPTITQILDAAFSHAQAIIVLITGDDEARLKSQYLQDDEPLYERQLTPQARANVLFEAGLAFGRQPSRTCLVSVGQTRPFSDVAGFHFVKTSSRDWRHDLMNRLRSAGCDIQVGGQTDWLTVGDFDDEARPSDLVGTARPGKAASALEGGLDCEPLVDPGGSLCIVLTNRLPRPIVDCRVQVREIARRSDAFSAVFSSKSTFAPFRLRIHDPLEPDEPLRFAIAHPDEKGAFIASGLDSSERPCHYEEHRTGDYRTELQIQAEGHTSTQTVMFRWMPPGKFELLVPE